MQLQGWFKAICGITFALSSVQIMAASPIEGYWKSIIESTGQQLSIIEIRKGQDQRYHGKIVYRYPAGNGGTTLTECVKCPEPYTNQPLIGLEIFQNYRQDPKHPKEFIDGRILEASSGKIYGGDGQKGRVVISNNGKRLRLHGYAEGSSLSRTVVWLKTNSPNP